MDTAYQPKKARSPPTDGEHGDSGAHQVRDAGGEAGHRQQDEPADIDHDTDDRGRQEAQELPDQRGHARCEI